MCWFVGESLLVSCAAADRVESGVFMGCILWPLQVRVASSVSLHTIVSSLVSNLQRIGPGDNESVWRACRGLGINNARLCECLVDPLLHVRSVAPWRCPRCQCVFPHCRYVFTHCDCIFPRCHCVFSHYLCVTHTPTLCMVCHSCVPTMLCQLSSVGSTLFPMRCGRAGAGGCAFHHP